MMMICCLCGGEETTCSNRNFHSCMMTLDYIFSLFKIVRFVFKSNDDDTRVKEGEKIFLLRVLLHKSVGHRQWLLKINS